MARPCALPTTDSEFALPCSKIAPPDPEVESAQLRALLRRSLDAVDAERSRLARALHDDLAQKLTGLSIELSLADDALASGDANSLAGVQERFAKLSHLADQAIKSTRQLITDLKPAALEEFGLAAGISSLASQFSQRTGLPCAVKVPPESIPLDLETARQALAICRHLLANIHQHAHATRASLELELHEGWLVLRVEDDGRGIADEDLESPRSLGLAEMRERARWIGGTLQINGIPADGTVATLRVPLNTARSGVAPGHTALCCTS